MTSSSALTAIGATRANANIAMKADKTGRVRRIVRIVISFFSLLDSR